MALTTVLNAILALGVLAVVVAPLAWVILSQPQQHLGPEATDGRSGGAGRTNPQFRPSSRAQRARGNQPQAANLATSRTHPRRQPPRPAHGPSA